MAITYRIELSELDLGQLIDGLEIRAESWEKTADYLRHQTFHDDDSFVIEDCSAPEEADRIAIHYRSIIDSLQRQREGQK